MPYRTYARRQSRRRVRRPEPIRPPGSTRRTLWRAAAGFIAAIVIIVLVLSAWTGKASPPSVVTLPVLGGEEMSSEQPVPIVLARVGSLSLKLPISRKSVTAIGYHASPGTVALSPEGTQVNEGLLMRLLHRIAGSGSGGLRYYKLSGGVGTDNGALDVGAPVGTDVYAPVDGKIVQIKPYIVNACQFGERIDIRPDADPTLIVSVSRLDADPDLVIGESVITGVTRIGSVIDFSKVQHQKLARYTHDSGNHVTIEVHPATIPVLS